MCYKSCTFSIDRRGCVVSRLTYSRKASVLLLSFFLSLFCHPDLNLPDNRETPRQKYIRSLVLGRTRKIQKFIQTFTGRGGQKVRHFASFLTRVVFDELWFRSVARWRKSKTSSCSADVLRLRHFASHPPVVFTVGSKVRNLIIYICPMRRSSSKTKQHTWYLPKFGLVRSPFFRNRGDSVDSRRENVLNLSRSPRAAAWRQEYIRDYWSLQLQLDSDILLACLFPFSLLRVGDHLVYQLVCTNNIHCCLSLAYREHSSTVLLTSPWCHLSYFAYPCLIFTGAKKCEIWPRFRP